MDDKRMAHLHEILGIADVIDTQARALLVELKDGFKVDREVVATVRQKLRDCLNLLERA